MLMISKYPLVLKQGPTADTESLNEQFRLVWGTTLQEED